MRPIHSVTSAERGKPVVSPAPYPMGSRESNPQGAPTGQQVKEEGGSECRPVMGRIGVEPAKQLGGTGRASCSPSPPRRQHHPARESGQTSLWSGVTREPDKQTSGGDADMSAAATLAGAVPGHGNMGCLLQVRIVKVSSGKRRRAESMRFDRTVVQFCVQGGLDLPTRPTRKSRHTKVKPGRTACPEAVIGHSEHRQPLWHEPRREEPRSARGVCPGLSCMHRNGARTVLSTTAQRRIWPGIFRIVEYRQPARRADHDGTANP